MPTTKTAPKAQKPNRKSAPIEVSLAEYRRRRSELEKWVSAGGQLLVRSKEGSMFIGLPYRSKAEQARARREQDKIDAEIIANGTPLTPEERAKIDPIFLAE